MLCLELQDIFCVHSLQGRGGKGSIFVWANGNGGEYDDCGDDGYASSIYTISVGAIGVQGNSSWFDEACSAKMVVTYVTDLEEYSSVVWPFKLLQIVRVWIFF